MILHCLGSQQEFTQATVCADAYVVIAGCRMLITQMKQRKALMILDDVDYMIQLKYLLPPCELHAESLVLITSRKRDFLDARRIYISEVQLLPKGRDVQLFKAWAFAAGPPIWDMSVLIPNMVACCNRLPLTLKVGADHALQRVERSCPCYLCVCKAK